MKKTILLSRMEIESNGSGTEKNSGESSSLSEKKRTSSLSLQPSNKSEIERVRNELEAFEQRISFDTERKIYRLQDENGQWQDSSPYSVTRLIHFYKPPFEAEKIASFVAKKNGTTPEAVLEKWTKENDFSVAYGTCLHKAIECFFAKKAFDFDEAKTQVKTKLSLSDDEWKWIQKKTFQAYKMFQNFVRDTSKNLEFLRSEGVVGDLNYTKICGTVDLIALNKQTQAIEIYDFKTNKKDCNSKQNYGDRFFPPLNHLTVCKQNEYALQLNLYKLIIERNTNLKVGRLNLLWINPETNMNYVVFEVKDLQKEAEALLADPLWKLFS